MSARHPDWDDPEKVSDAELRIFTNPLVVYLMRDVHEANEQEAERVYRECHESEADCQDTEGPEDYGE